MRYFALVCLAACGSPASVSNDSANLSQGSYGPATPDEGALDGQSFCRMVEQRSHCVSFLAMKMKDNANTFFGNPPETLSYKLSGSTVSVQRDGKWEQAYAYSDDTLSNDAGAILLSTLYLDGRSYCRPVQNGKHCLKFQDGSVTDNANTFFGNPPETLDYSLTGSNLGVVKTDSREIEVYYTYDLDADTITNSTGAQKFTREK